MRMSVATVNSVPNKMASNSPSPNEEVNEKDKNDEDEKRNPLTSDWDEENDDTDVEEECLKKLTLFCKTCLAPFVGEESESGQLELKCKKCELRDKVTDLVANLKDEGEEDEATMIGDLVSKKFNNILKFEKELKKLDVNDPYSISDDFCRVYAFHTPIIHVVTKTTNLIRRMINDYRMEHNLYVCTKVKGIKEQLEQNPNIAAHVNLEVREKPRAYYVEYSGSVDNSNFILDPKTFNLPEYLVTNVKIRGSEGVRELDKLLLQLGLPNVFIKQNMPLYQKRIGFYRRYMPCKYNPRAKRRPNQTKCPTCFNSISKTYALPANCPGTSIFRISDNDILSDDLGGHFLVESICPYHSRFCDSPIEIRSKLKRKERLKQSKSVTQREFDAMLKSLVITFGDPNDMDPISFDYDEHWNEVASMRRGLGQEVVIQNEDILEFKNYIGKTDYQSDYNEQLFILEHMDYVPIGQLQDYSQDKVNEVFVEVVEGVTKRRDKALEDRRLRAIDYLQVTADKMCQRVNDIRNEVVGELKHAYRAKLIRSNRQKKQLEEKKARMEDFSKMLKMYEKTGDLQKILEIQNEVNKWKEENPE